jgi:hypothetical protein
VFNLRHYGDVLVEVDSRVGRNVTGVVAPDGRPGIVDDRVRVGGFESTASVTGGLFHSLIFEGSVSEPGPGGVRQLDGTGVFFQDILDVSAACYVRFACRARGRAQVTIVGR